MNPQYLCRTTLIALRLIKYALYEALLEFADCLVEHNSFVNHLRN